MTQSAHIDGADAVARRRGARADRGGNAHDAGETGRAEAPMTIAEVAREFAVTLRALRFYESKRLIAPQRHGAVRLYHRSDCERLALILTGRRLGFTLAEIGRLLDGPNGKNLHLTRQECVEQITLLERQKRDIDLALGELRQIYTSFYTSQLDDRMCC